ncbi:MAG: LTA synthase family protein [Marinifilaceae bacterium]|jgi:phosphoglycerol transferase MdoB-like AlkP superfamily enzyme|nr:LTA synthase family protein [Marinifilaceae bacterium]
MKNRLIFLGISSLFWLIFFQLYRLVFLFYQFDAFNDFKAYDIIHAFASGLKHDMSLVGYIMALSLLLLSIFFFLDGKKLAKTFKIIYGSLITVSAFVLTVNLELYRNWNFHIDATVFSYLKTPKEAMASTNLSTQIYLWIIFFALTTTFIVLINKLLIKRLNKINKINIIYLPIILFLLASMIIPIRGGFGIAPMNVGFVYFSKHSSLNHLAVNPIWNLSYSMKKMGNKSKTYKFIPQDKQQITTDSLFFDQANSLKLLKTKRPNIVLLILESFTIHATGLIDSTKSYTPNLDKYAKEGVNFSNFYAVGDRSKIGLVGLLSSYPSLPQKAVVEDPKKMERLPSLCRRLNEQNYKSSFYYGGNIKFANLNSYFNTMGFSEIITEDNYSDSLNNSKWGVHDEYVFDRLYSDIENCDSNFFKTVFTLTSHEPFGLPHNRENKGKTEDEKFLNTIHYTDSCLGNFVERLRASKYWDNSLVIMLADHGVRYIKNFKNHNIPKYHIPMVWLGGALAKKSVTVDKIASQTDLSKTILSQLDITCDEFIFGKNILSEKSNSFAYFAYNNGFGYIDNKSQSVYDLNSNKYIVKEGEDRQTEWQSILQKLSEDFKK